MNHVGPLEENVDCAMRFWTAIACFFIKLRTSQLRAEFVHD